ncbi:hypothetical protein ABFS82_12G019700 [Erythranthe guttata]|uniref:Peroxidase n=1 Tax=Erythranthe guttata TaxID=4155 RepID=A0A022QNW9_ERYGU|nr:PREDICTED: peroxidase 73-like [Erythranthe guttata]EYU29641.1 hypothetical protein MIMGU_mgv1a009564mg [Erythranthe guttata]|eukprot:XP_012846681.1 PREDICTED: peroxidase 73-like [Erythranthe guttata]
MRKTDMGRVNSLTSLILSLSVSIILFSGHPTSAELRQNFYSNICPDVENIVRSAVSRKASQTSITIPGTLRLFFHDCFVSGCDASVIVASTERNTAEKDHPDNLSLAGDGFDTVIKAKAAVDAVPRCKNKVSCADILALAARDVIVLAGGPTYPVELGRLDGLSSTSASVNGNLPQPNFNLNQLNSMFASRGLTQADMIALSGAHTLGFTHCSRITNRIYNFSSANPVDPTLNKQYASQLQATCRRNESDPRISVNLDPTTPGIFDNAYFENLIQGKGIFTSDQVLFTDSRSRNIVTNWASDSRAFNDAFIRAITKLGRVGVKTQGNGNIRFDCAKFN